MTNDTRIEQIRKSLDIAKSGQIATYTVRPWRNSELVCTIITVHSTFLRYRIDNSRTTIQQLAYLRNHPELPADLFEDPESTLTQNAQEKILLELVLNKKDFLVDLEARGQVEPAIITFDGYILNGNRRTAALKHTGVSYIKCVVLPEDSTSQELYELEQELQLAKEFKEPYHWINELNNIRKGVVMYKLSAEQQAKTLRLNNKKDVEIRLRRLDLIDSFLSWKGMKGHYDYEKLDDTEQVFMDLEKALRSHSFKKDIEKQDDLKKAIFGLIENKPKKGRVYDYVGDLIRKIDQLRTENVETLPTNVVKIHQVIEEDDIKTKDQSLSDDGFIKKNQVQDPFDALLESESKKETKKVFIGFDNPEEAKNNITGLLDKLEDIKALEKEKNNKDALYESVSKSLRELQGLSVSPESSKLDVVNIKLIQIKEKCDELIGHIKILLKQV